MRQDDFDRGLQRRCAVLGQEWVERATAGATAFTAEWQDFITRTAWHAVWGREGLSTETRRLLAMTSTLALGRWEEYEMHVHAALAAGISEAVLQDMLQLAALYAGVPAANTGFRIAAAALAGAGRQSPASPLTSSLRERSFHTFSLPQTHVVLQGSGTGTPVVLCHALGLDLSMWAAVAGRLAARGHPVLRYDLQGHGASELAGQLVIDDLVDDAARVVGEWNRGSVVIVGLSLGGIVAQGLAIRHPQHVRGLVLSNTVACYPPQARNDFLERAAQVRAGGMAAVVDAALQRYLTPEFQQREPAATQQLRAQLLRCSPAAYAACCEVLASVDWYSGLASIQVPTWIVSGASDQAAPTSLQHALAQRIGHALHTVLPGGHLPTLEAPDAFVEGIEGFLSERLAAGPYAGTD
jgi:3-oxoadipate enol-lactonase